MKKIFIIIISISVVCISSFIDLNAIFKNEFTYNNKLFVQMFIIITCLVIAFKLVLELIDPDIFNVFKKNKPELPKKKRVVNQKKINNQYKTYKRVLENHQKRKEEKRAKENNLVSSDAKLKKQKLELYLKNEEKRKQKLKEEELELNNLIALEEKKRKEKKILKKTAGSKGLINKENKTKTTVPKVKANKENPVKNIKEKETRTTNTLKKVNFLTNNVKEFTAQYPIIRKPKIGSIIRSYRIGRNNRKGFKEEVLYKAIKEHFYNDFNVIDNAMLAIGNGTNPFEPDIAMLAKGTKNIYIDIEIDEPYAGVSRKLTHCYPEDTSRDNYFVDRGWFVIRFSEYQVHHQLEECIYEIEKVISKIETNYIFKKNHLRTTIDIEE